MAPDGSRLRQLTRGSYDDREPRWSPDGRTIAFASDRDGSYDIWTVDVETGALAQWTDTPDTEEAEPAWSPSGVRMTYVVDETTIQASTAGSAARLLVDAGDDTVSAPSLSAQGRLAYVRGDGVRSRLIVSGRPLTGGEDVFPFPAEWLSDDRLLYTADGQIKTRSLTAAVPESVPFEASLPVEVARYEPKEFDFDAEAARPVEGIVSPQVAPDGNMIAFIALNDVWVAGLNGAKPRRVTNDDFFESDVAWSPDGRRLVYSSDKAGTPDLSVRDLAGGRERRVTSLGDAEVAAAWSPDGRRLAFQNQDGATFIVNIATGAVRQVYGELFLPGRPTWSADGRTVAFAALKPYSERFREGTSQVLTVDVRDGTWRYTPPLPQNRHASIATRGDDGPVWSPDGRWMAFVVDSLLWVVPVDAGGQPTGVARPISREATDAPSWTGDSRSLLYLHNGRLRMVDRDGQNLRAVPLHVRWRRAMPDTTVTIHAGSFWDGVDRRLRRNVDITIVGNRIARIAAHSEAGHVGGWSTPPS